MDPERASTFDLAVPVADFLDGKRRNPDHHLHGYLCTHLGIPAATLKGYRILKRSLDARDRHRLILRYRVTVDLGDIPQPETLVPTTDLHAPIIVGTGPAGLFAAELLAHHGRTPLIIDRGAPVERRNADVGTFQATGRLDPESNLLYGEGGAGTYSDGKLYTQTRNPRIAAILEILVACRAPSRIRYDAHPHIGSDILPHVVRRLRRRIEGLGGTFRWDAPVQDLLVEQGTCVGIRLANGEALRGPVLLATGHSDRDLLRRLVERGVPYQAKGFQLGARIEHPQAFIDVRRYGRTLPPWVAPAADYQLHSRPPRGGAGVTSFCMCPGGEILAATPRPGALCTNGGSRFARHSGFANAALIVNQEVMDPLAAFELLDRLETAAYAAGGGNFVATGQRAMDFLAGRPTRSNLPGSYRLGMTPGRVDSLLPKATADAIRSALRFFDRKLPGFIPEGQFVGIETRVSSPVRFERDAQTLASGLPGLWLAGEGAGCAGGIMSAAVDGVRIAEAMLVGHALEQAVEKQPAGG